MTALANWLAFSHHSYGNWQMLLEAQWFDTWCLACIKAGKPELINWAMRYQCPALFPSVQARQW